jgi:hypothetical protein
MWHKESGEAAPPWAAAARQKGLGHVRRHAAKLGLADPDAELQLSSVAEDDRGMTNVAMQQIHDGVPVFGGTMLVTLDAGGQPLGHDKDEDKRAARTGTSIDTVTPSEDKYVPGVYATIYADARRLGTAPTLSAAQAVSAAKSALGYGGSSASRREPS